MINGVKSGRQIEKRQKRNSIMNLSREKVLNDSEECYFSVVTSVITGMIRGSADCL